MGAAQLEAAEGGADAVTHDALCRLAPRVRDVHVHQRPVHRLVHLVRPQRAVQVRPLVNVHVQKPASGGRNEHSLFTVIWKEGNVLFNEALNTFYLRLHGVGHMVKDHSDSERKEFVLFNDELST